MRLTFHKVAARTALIVFVCGAALAQLQAAVIEGEVVDFALAVIPQATVLLINERDLTTVTATTDDMGKFRFEVQSPGTYEVKAVARSFAVAAKRIRLKAGETKKVRLKLRIRSNAIVE